MSDEKEDEMISKTVAILLTTATAMWLSSVVRDFRK